MLDKIKLAERAQRLEALKRKANDGTRAAYALAWFAEHVPQSDAPEDAINISVNPVASSTPKAETAQYYLSRAALSFKLDILDRAVEMAEADLQEAEALS